MILFFIWCLIHFILFCKKCFYTSVLCKGVFYFCNNYRISNSCSLSLFIGCKLNHSGILLLITSVPLITSVHLICLLWHIWLVMKVSNWQSTKAESVPPRLQANHVLLLLARSGKWFAVIPAATQKESFITKIVAFCERCCIVKLMSTTNCRNHARWTPLQLCNHFLMQFLNFWLLTFNQQRVRDTNPMSYDIQ